MRKHVAEERPGLVDRLLTAVAFPVVFNLSLVTVTAFFGPRKVWLVLLLNGAGRILLLCVLLPAALGFGLGSARSATLLGHLFYTHGEYRRSLLLTFALWLGLLALVWIASADSFAALVEFRDQDV